MWELKLNGEKSAMKIIMMGQAIQEQKFDGKNGIRIAQGRKMPIPDEDIDDIQIELGAGYEKWFIENFPESKKRISPASIRVSDFMTYMGTSQKDKPLPNLVKDGVVDLTMWKLKDLKMEALNSCRDFLGIGKKTA